MTYHHWQTGRNISDSQMTSLLQPHLWKNIFQDRTLANVQAFNTPPINEDLTILPTSSPNLLPSNSSFSSSSSSSFFSSSSAVSLPSPSTVRIKEPPLELPVRERSCTGLSVGVFTPTRSPTRSALRVKYTPPSASSSSSSSSSFRVAHPPSPPSSSSSQIEMHTIQHHPPSTNLIDSQASLMGTNEVRFTDASEKDQAKPRITRPRSRHVVNKGMSKYARKLTKVSEKLASNIPKVRTQVEKVTADSVYAQSVIIPFLLELGKALHVCGVPAHVLEYELTLVATSFGIEGNYFFTPTGIFCSFGDPNTVLSPHTHLIRVGGADFDLEKLCLLEELAKSVSKKRISCDEGVEIIHKIMSMPPRYPEVLGIMAIVLLSFSIGIYFGLTWKQSGGTILVGIFMAVILQLARKVSAVGRIAEVLAGLGCALLASVYSSCVTYVNVFIVALAGVIWIVPGLSITFAIAELSTKNLLSGTTRLMGAFVCILQLTIGIIGGVKLGEAMFDSREPITERLSSYWNYGATFGLAISISILLRVPPKQVWAVCVASYLGTVGGSYATELLGNLVGSFFGAFVICIFGNLYARIIQRCVSLVPIIVAVLILVPGSLSMNAFANIVENNVQGGIVSLGSVFQTCMALTMGLLTANLLVRPYKAL